MLSFRSLAATVMFLLCGLVHGQGEHLRALSARPGDHAPTEGLKSGLNTHFIYSFESLSIPIMDDFSIDRTRKRWAQPGDPDVTLVQTIYALEVSGVSEPDMAYATDTTFRYLIDMSDPDLPVTTREALPMVVVTVRDVTAYPPAVSTEDAWPPYNIFDTLLTPPEDTLWLLTPGLVQDSLLVYSVAPDPRTYVMNNITTPLILWEDDDVYINGTYPVDPPTVGVATFDGLARTGYPYNFAQFSSYGIADHLTSVPIDLDLPPGDSIYLSFFYQPRGLSGDAQAQPQDSLVLEFYSPTEDDWFRVWRTPYTALAPFQQVLVPIKEDRFLQEGFRMRFLNYATLSGSFDHWHLDYVRLGAQRTFNDVELVDVAYVHPESTLLQTYTSMPFNKFEESPASYMVQSLSIPIRNLDDNDRFITWRMQAGIDGEAVSFDPAAYGNNTSGNASSVFNSLHPINSAPNNFVYDATLSEDAAFWRVRFLTNATPDINRYNDTITFVQEISNYYAYDDGSAEMGYGLDATGAKLAYRFDIVGGDSLRAIRMYFNPMANPPPAVQPQQGSFLITIWKSLEPELIQHQNFSFSTPEYKQDGLNRFVEYPLDSTIFVEGTFYIGWAQTNAASMNLGFDRNRNNQNKISFKTGINWQQTSFEGSLMMRPVFVAAVDPFVGLEEPEVPGQLRLFPNPAASAFRVAHESAMGVPLGLQVTDALGRTVIERQVGPLEEIGTLQWPNGLYVVRVTDGQGQLLGAERLIIQH
jgi:hypothetical protein